MQKKSKVATQAPLKIYIHSDNNELELQHSMKGTATYKYTKSKTKLGVLIHFNEEQLEQFLKWLPQPQNKMK